MNNLTETLDKLKQLSDEIDTRNKTLAKLQEERRAVEYQVRRMMWDLKEMERNTNG